VRCPNCGTNNPPEEQLTYCKNCGTELRVVCPRCSTDNGGFEEYCRECGLELHPDRGHERAGGIRRDRGGGSEEPPVISRSTQFILGGILVAAIVWLPILNTVRQRSQFNSCQSHLKQIAVALQMYARDSDELLPLAENWTPAVLRYLKDSDSLSCPSRAGRYGYAYNENLSMVRLNRSALSTSIGFFEMAGDAPNMSGTDLDWLNPPAHSGGNNIVLLSGEVKLLSKKPNLAYWEAPVAPHTPPTWNQPPTPQEPPLAEGGSEGTGGEETAGATPTNPPPPTAAP
jgi:hypothetical protein